MSFPVFESKATSVSSSSLTTHTIDTPAGVVSGDLLIAFIALENETGSPQFSSWSDGFTEIKDKTTGGGAGASVGVAYKVSDGTEGANITVDSVDAERAAHAMYRYSNFDPAIAPEISAGASGLSAAPDPDSLTPAGGAKDYKFMVFCAFEKDDETITGFPTNYGSNQTNHSMFSGATIGIADRDLNAASEDPGAFSMSGSKEWQAFTLAIHPLPSAAITGTAEPTSTEAQIISGGRTIIITLTGDTWVAAGAAFDAQRQNIIDDLTSAQSENFGWNGEVKDNLPVTAVVRTSDTVVTITLVAVPNYDITATETITVTVPATALVTSSSDIIATPTFTVTASTATAAISGTATAAIDETNVRVGGDTIIITLANGSWIGAGAPFDAQRQAIIDGLDSAQVEAAGWNAEVRDNLPVTAVVRTSQRVVTITLTAQAAYDITAQETITVTVPASAILETGPITGAPTFTVDPLPVTAAITGTVTPASTEAQIVAGGRTIIITLTEDTWVAAGAAFNLARQAIIDGITSAQAELTGWNNEVRDNLPVGQVTRTSDTVVTIALVPETGYNITDKEIITVTVPASALVVSAVPVVATPTFTIFEVPVALISGTIVPSATVAEIVDGGKTIIITLIDDEWLPAGVPFNDSRQDIIQGIESDITGIQAPNGWNQVVKDDLPDGQVIRTSDTVVTITLTAFATYDSNGFVETITVTVPGSALAETPNDIIGTPTFQVKAGGTHMRSRRGGKHAEDLFDVNEPDVQTFEVNKFE